MNLLFVLLNSKRPISREQIRIMVPGYPESQAAFERMFERDKEQLRAVGVDIKTQPMDSLFEDSLGYLIERPGRVRDLEISLDEVALIRLAEQAWRDPNLTLLAKKGAVTVESAKGTPALAVDPLKTQSVAMMNERLSMKVVPLIEAISTKRQISFSYQKATDDVSSARTIEPWRVFFSNSAWYVIGYDTGSKAPRTYRLSRIINTPKVLEAMNQLPLPSLKELEQMSQQTLSARRLATIRVHSDSPAEVRTYFRSVMVSDQDSDEGYEGQVGYWDANEYAAFLVRFAGFVTVIHPPELADALSANAQALLRRLQES